MGGLAAIALLVGGCLPMPVQRGPEFSGQVLDAATGSPLAGAILVVRWDTRHDDLLPDRDLLGHVEVVSGQDGRFEAGPLWRPRLAVWPLFRVEARVVAVLADGYRCAGPIAVPKEGGVEIGLVPSSDLADRRLSCRPVAAEPKVVPRYVAAWRGLHPEADTLVEKLRGRRIQEVLEARSALGFGANCDGPVHDLAVSPDGERIAFRVNDGQGDWVGIVRAEGATPLERLLVDVPDTGRWQLGWTNADELVLWEPSNDMDRTHSLALVSLAGGAPRVLWRAPPPPPPAAPGYDLALSRSHDRARALWLGRSFRMLRTIDPITGLSREVLRVAHENGSMQDIGLPGEPCGQVARFGSLDDRVADRGRTAFDLRHVKGACRAVAVDLWSGSWRVIDDARGEGVCRESRSFPASQLQIALAGYMDEIQMALEREDADPRASFSIRIEDDGATSVASRGYDGEIRVLPIPSFPLATPLRRIDVAVLGSTGAPRSSGSTLEPL
jgi:hypothetical protein